MGTFRWADIIEEGRHCLVLRLVGDRAFSLFRVRVDIFVVDLVLHFSRVRLQSWKKLHNLFSNPPSIIGLTLHKFKNPVNVFFFRVFERFCNNYYPPEMS